MSAFVLYGHICDLLESDKKWLLQQFEGDGDLEKNIPKQNHQATCIFSSDSFLKKNDYIINLNIEFFYFIFIKNNNKDANKQ